MRRYGALRITPLTGPKQKGFSVLHIRVGPNLAGPSLYHRRTQEFFYVLSGSSSGVIGGRKVRFKRGDSAFIPAGTPHRFIAGPSGTELLDVFVPPLDLDAPDNVEVP